jgi:hypothetical protein
MMGDPTLEITTDIVLIDIVGYSLLSDEEQLLAVDVVNTYLSQQILFLSELMNLRKEEVIIGFIPTGDGMYILLNPQVCGYGIMLGPSIRNYLLWISSVELNSLYKGVRAGIHMGKVLTFNDVNGCRNYVGGGLNDCARLLSITDEAATAFGGDTNYVVASESACFWFSKLYKGDEAERFLSTMKFKMSDQIQITDKHKKIHSAYLIDLSRCVQIQPPNFIRPRKRRHDT